LALRHTRAGGYPKILLQTNNTFKKNIDVLLFILLAFMSLISLDSRLPRKYRFAENSLLIAGMTAGV
jgi:hypothetical protein